MIDYILAGRRNIPIDCSFLDPKRLDTLSFPQYDFLSQETLKVNVVCTADVMNEVIVLDDIAYIILDLTTIETYFRFLQGGQRYGIGCEEDTTKLSLLRLALIKSLSFSDSVITAGLLAEYISERCRLEAVIEPNGLIFDSGTPEDNIAKNGLAAFAIGHEIGHLMYRKSRRFRKGINEHLEYVLANLIPSISTQYLGDERILDYLKRLTIDLKRPEKDEVFSIDLEEVACDMFAAATVLQAISKYGKDEKSIRIAFTAIQMFISVNWLINIVDMAFGCIISNAPMLAIRHREIIGVRSLIVACYAAGYRLEVLEGISRPSDVDIRDVLKDMPEADRAIEMSFYQLFSKCALLQRNYLGRIYTGFKLVSEDALFETVVRVIRDIEEK